MRKYWEMTKSQIKVSISYRMWFWAGLFMNVLKMIITYYFWHAVYENRTLVGGQTLGSMLTYLIIAMMLGGFFFSGAGTKLAEYIRDGSVAIELMRPYDLLTKLLFLDFGDKLSGLMQTLLPMLVVAYLFFGIQAPPSWLSAGLFVISALLGIVLSTVFSMLFGVLAFWTVNLFGLNILRNAIQLFFTGAMIPISLFPLWLQTVSYFMPFQSMIYVPSAIYAGTIRGVNAFSAIGLQVVWLVIVYVVVRVVWSLAMRKVTIFGG